MTHASGRRPLRFHVLRALLLAAAALLPGCGRGSPDLISTLEGRCEGRWVVMDTDRARLPDGGILRDRLTITIASREQVGDALVPGGIYARGSLAWGGQARPFQLEYPPGSRDMGCAFARYDDARVDVVTGLDAAADAESRGAPSGPGGARGFNLLLLTRGPREQDLLCVDFSRDAPVAAGTEHMLRFVRAPDAE